MKNLIRLEKVDDDYHVYFDNGVLLGEFYAEVDGYYVFTPKLRGGFWKSYVLRTIADKLDELNKEWDEQIKRELLDINNYNEL